MFQVPVCYSYRSKHFVLMCLNFCVLYVFTLQSLEQVEVNPVHSTDTLVRQNFHYNYSYIIYFLFQAQTLVILLVYI